MKLTIQLNENRTAYRPGEPLHGTAGWALDNNASAPVTVSTQAPMPTLELHLFWFTEGRGDRDMQVIASLRFENPAASDEKPFTFQLPQGPYSFTGKLITLQWALELIITPGDTTERMLITLSPSGASVVLGS